MTTNATGQALLVASISNRACTSNHNDSRSTRKSAFESNLHIAQHINRGRKNFPQRTPHCVYNVRTRRSGSSYARIRNLCGIDSGRSASLTHTLMQRLTGSRFSNPNDVARARRGCRQNRRLVSNGADGLTSAAVHAKIIAHGSVLPHEIRDNSSALAATHHSGKLPPSGTLDGSRIVNSHPERREQRRNLKRQIPHHID